MSRSEKKPGVKKQYQYIETFLEYVYGNYDERRAAYEIQTTYKKAAKLVTSYEKEGYVVTHLSTSSCGAHNEFLLTTLVFTKSSS